MVPKKSCKSRLGRLFSQWSACYASIRMWVLISSTHVKSLLLWHLSMKPALEMQSQEDPYGLLASPASWIHRHHSQWETLPFSKSKMESEEDTYCQPLTSPAHEHGGVKHKHSCTRERDLKLLEYYPVSSLALEKQPSRWALALCGTSRHTLTQGSYKASHSAAQTPLPIADHLGHQVWECSSMPIPWVSVSCLLQTAFCKLQWMV